MSLVIKIILRSKNKAALNISTQRNKENKPKLPADMQNLNQQTEQSMIDSVLM